MNYAVAKLEFSPDPLSDTTPSWVDITTKCRSADWFGGKVKDLDDPQAGGATFVLRNDNRMFEPEYVAGPFYPNIVPLRRFRLSIVTAAGLSSEGIYYATDWGVAYPAGTGYSEVTVTCVDGFGLLSLALLPALNPPDAATLADVQAYDQPFAQFTLSDTGSTKMAASTGDDGTYKNGPQLGAAALVPGDQGTAVVFGPGANTCGRVPLADSSQFSDGDVFTVEAVVDVESIGTRVICGGPWDTGVSQHTFMLTLGGAQISTAAVSANIISYNPGVAFDGVHHLALVWNGNAMILYDGGVEVGRNACGSNLIPGVAGEFLYVGGSTHITSSDTITVSHAAFYDRALSASRIAAHAAAALSSGYVAQTAGDRINALAANPLWSTAAITPSAFTVAPRMRVGQATLEEIVLTAQAEAPFGLFYFNDAGNPAYRGWDQATGVIQATFGDAPGEIGYTSIGLAYDDEIYNTVSVTRDQGTAQMTSDATSIAAYGVRSLSPSGLILDDDGDAQTVAVELLGRFKDPAFRVETLTLNGANPLALPHILAREIGDMVRVRRRGVSGLPIDIVTTIIGKHKTIDPNGNLACQWNLARGFNAADGFWHLGITGFSELGQTTVLA